MVYFNKQKCYENLKLKCPKAKRKSCRVKTEPYPLVRLPLLRTILKAAPCTPGWFQGWVQCGVFGTGSSFTLRWGDVFSGVSKSKGWASPEWPPCLPSSPPWITLAAAHSDPSSSLPLFRRPERTACIYALCVLTSVPALLVCLFFGSTRVTRPIWEEETWERTALLISSPAPPHSCQDDCSTESVWGYHASAEKVFIIPLLFKTLGARGVQQLGVCTWAAPAKLPIQIHPGVPREADPTLGVNAVVPLASSPTCPFSLRLPGIFQPIPTWVFFSPCTAVWYFLSLKFLQTVSPTKNALLCSSSKHWSRSSSDNLHTLQWSGIAFPRSFL